MPLSKDLENAIATWNSYNKCQQFQEELEQFLKEGDETKISDRFLNRLDFGTAGLRGRMGCGFNAMNDVVVIQVGQGLLEYVDREVPDASTRGIVIGYDGRHHSRRFAELTATIFLLADYRVYLYSELVPTPFVPFALRSFKAAVGVMVTASHNPKEDNGYKVYWENATQIKSPLDKNIKKCIMSNLEPRETSWKTEIIATHANWIDPLEIIMEQYARRRVDVAYCLDMNKKSSIQFTYTAMHGVGYRYIKDVFQCLKLQPLLPVVEQVDPDPDFPTVKFPNPEEGKSALDLAIQTANKNGTTVIFANDPDADRFGFAEKLKSSNQWKIFTGNEIGALLGWWLLEDFRKKNPNKRDLSDTYFISSTVSSKILRTIAKAESMQFEETLTGFKWMGSRAYELMRSGKTVIFAFEESIGYMCDTECLDKDGISAAGKMAELYIHIQDKCVNFQDKLDQIYDKYGHHLNTNSYFFCYDKETIKKIFSRLRTWSGEKNAYPESIGDGKYIISGIRDLTAGYDSSTPNNIPLLPVSASSEMITFDFDNGFTCTLRTSGTEPKIKYYAEMIATPDQKDTDAIQDSLNDMMELIIEEFLQPNQNHLVEKAD